MKEKVNLKLQKISNSVLQMAGIFSSQMPGTRHAGNSKLGANVFVGDKVAQSSDINAGKGLLHLLAMIVTPFNVLTKKEKESMDRLLTLSGDKKFIDELDALHLKRDGESFATRLIRGIGAPTSHALAVLTAVKLYDHWGVISPAQKSLAIAAMGVQLHKTDKNGAICDLKIIDGPDQTFTVSDALQLIQQGKNPYTLVRNWDQIYRLCRVNIDKPNLQALEDFAASHNLLGAGVTDAAVPGVTKAQIQKVGAKAAPQYGVGAVAAPSGSNPPRGYAKVAATKGGDILAPQANVRSSVGAVQGSLLGTDAGANGTSADASAIYKKWNPKDAKTKDKGADGGSAFVAGLSALKRSAPYLYSALVSFLARYSHTSINSADPAKYLASLAGIALARIVSGKSEDKADKEGIAVANSLNAVNTPGDYAKLQVDLRALYANFGVSSRADAYQLSNQAYAESRITESDLVALHEVYDLIYNANSMAEVEKLLQGKDKGLQVIRTEGPMPHNTMTHGEIHNQALVNKNATKEEIRKRNAIRYAKKNTPSPDESSEQEPSAPQTGAQGSPSDETETAPQSQVPQMGATP